MADVSLDVAPAQSQPSMMMKGNHQNQRRQYGNGGGNNNGRCCTCRGRRGVCSLILMTIMQVIVLLVALFGTMTVRSVRDGFVNLQLDELISTMISTIR
mmetsp:Transcript_12159/g.32281  ORF Transcript_12159/g.32281 Transcript_12159/m.32281 type:complete len:99 (-) Transcript_12159:1000-1296(-)